MPARKRYRRRSGVEQRRWRKSRGICLDAMAALMRVSPRTQRNRESGIYDTPKLAREKLAEMGCELTPSGPEDKLTLAEGRAICRVER